MHRLLGLLALTALHAASDGEQVIRDAYARYEGRWFRSLTFVQKTTFADGRVETWYESLVLPGRLRIDYAPAEAGRAVIFRNDSLYAYRGGTLQGAQGRAHPLLVVLYDLHAQDPELTIARLRTLGFDLSKVHRTRWQGDSVIVVGATAGDTTSRQVWFDARRLIAVRLIDPGPQGLADTQIGGYAAVGPWWHERDIIFRVNGKVTLREEVHRRADRCAVARVGVRAGCDVGAPGLGRRAGAALAAGPPNRAGHCRPNHVEDPGVVR